MVKQDITRDSGSRVVGSIPARRVKKARGSCWSLLLFL